MLVTTFDDTAEWLESAEALLVRDEARNDLVLGIADTLIRHPAVYAEKHLWTVDRGGTVVGAALQTPPHNLVFARPGADGVTAALAESILDAGVHLPGVTAADPEAVAFASDWASLTGAHHRRVMGQGVYTLHEVRMVPAASGRFRKAEGPEDLALILAWLGMFQDEVFPAEIRASPEESRRRAEGVFSSDVGGFWLWEDAGVATSMAGVGSATPNGIRIGPVYTPPDLRARGYATSLVADVSRDQLRGGRSFCFLHTDLANPTSNAIDRRIGYEHVCDPLVIAFEEG